VAKARYDAVADFYAAGWTDVYDDPATASLLHHIGGVSGKRVLDVACGHGRISRELARRGAQVVGIDISEALLVKATQIEEHEPLGIDYILADIGASPGVWARTGFDLAVCSFGLSDIDDLDAALASIAAALNADARFVFSILHPCFPGDSDVSGSWPSGASYAAEGWWAADAAASTLRAQVGATHRMLSTYVNALRRAGFALLHLDEPPPPPVWETAHPQAARHPVFLITSCVRPRDLSGQPRSGLGRGA
jgi:2-polyprenyl-3-methyl-5-hydroxy-6-metoxy-1,4-benzoquinol methylase